MLSEETKNMLVYFHRHKGDITASSEWDEKQDEIQHEYPELIHAVNNLKTAERMLEAVVSNIEREI